jgi:hypothetical protein
MRIPLRAVLVATIFSALGTLIPARAARADAPETLDQGVFHISAHGKPLGVESFSFLERGDTTVVTAQSFVMVPGPGGVDSVSKRVSLTVSAFDYDLRRYFSEQRGGGRVLRAGLTRGDTTFASYRDRDGRGEGLTYTLPPGRVFVLDPHVFTLFDVVCRNLKGKTFATWPLTMIALGPDSTLILHVTAERKGEEPFHWGARRVTAVHYAIGDARATYDVWAGPDGHMLRLEHTPSGLRVEREPPAGRRVRKPRPRAG